MCQVPETCRAYNGRMSIVPVLIAATVIVGPIALYFAVRFREVRKFLAGAFFVSAGMQMYFWQIGLSIPLYDTGFIQSPEASLVRSGIHFVLFLLCLYFGFIKNPQVRQV